MDPSYKEQNTSSSDEYSAVKVSHRKRRKLTRSAKAKSTTLNVKRELLVDASQVSVGTTETLLDSFIASVHEINPSDDYDFEDFIESLLPELIEAAANAQVENLKYDGLGSQVIPISRMQRKILIDQFPSRDKQTFAEALLRRRLLLERGSLRSIILGVDKNPLLASAKPITPLTMPTHADANMEVIDALHSIKTTPYDNSFLSRMQGVQSTQNIGCLAVDWENRTPWMDLMQDIRDHFWLMHPDREKSSEVEAPIEYVTLQRCHLSQVHEILARAFWKGIDVSDSLEYSPERCTVIATYKKMVVGVALLSSPQETYITYLAVKPGWDNAQIAKSMLYHLITLNPRKDIILHVSINNPAMLLYNRFGFKAEEFIVGFYEDYLDPKSRASKNAFRLRLRQ